MNAIAEEVKKDKILFVDDEAFILFSLRRYFRQQGIEVDVETDCIKAVEMVKENNYKVIISDFRMPMMNGADFLDVVKELSPSSVRLMLSAYISQETLLEIINKGEVFRFINKPWNEKELLAIIKESISRYDKATKVPEVVLVPAPVVAPEVVALKTEKIDESLKIEEERDYFQSILPEEKFENVEIKKLCEILRVEQHQHLNYIINLFSGRIANHCKRVSQLSVYIASVLKLDKDALKRLYYAGLYHDIGKIFELVTQTDHSELGANILSNHLELKEAANVVRYHHKRLDEEGASSIPIESKILAIVDHFDKMVSVDYNAELGEKPESLPQILALMDKEKGKKFDPEILETFKEIILKDFKMEMFFNERKIHIVELEEAMVLSRPLFNIEGKLLLNSDYKITKEMLKRLLKHHDLVGIKNPFYVYEKVPDKKFSFEEVIGKKTKINEF